MKKFKSLTLENFQSHEHTTIDFDDNFTVIVGASDQGKSAIIRALKWVLFNEPQGDDFIRVGTDGARVTLTLDNGTIIIRERGKKNRYILRQGENEYVFESFGRGVPREILDAHGIKSIKLDDNLSLRLSLSEQLDGPFLLSQSKPVKAKTIGYLSGVNIIDKAIRDVSLEIKQKSAEERIKEENVSRITGELENFADLDQLEKILPEIKDAYSGIQQLKDKLDKLRLSSEKLSRIEKRIDKDRQLVNTLAELPENEISHLSEVYTKYVTLSRNNARLKVIKHKAGISAALLENTGGMEEVSKEIDGLDALCHNLNRMMDCNTKLKNLDASLAKCKTGLMELKVSEECSKRLDEIQVIVPKLSRLRDCLDKMNNLEKYAKNVRLKYEKAQNEKERHLLRYSEILKNLGRCPVCGSPIDDHTAESIIEEFK